MEQTTLLVLASNSPRRRQLLALGGWRVSIAPAEIDENPISGEDPRQYAMRMAAGKAKAVAESMQQDAIVIGADTIVVDKDTHGSEIILGKPLDDAEAGAMLRRLRGRTHKVYTSIAVVRTRNGVAHTDLCETEVKMRNYSDEEINSYVASGDPIDKAGAYAIQHEEFDPAESVRGCYANVVGLPLCYVARMLGKVGLELETDITRECRFNLEYPCLVYRQVTSKGTSR